MDDIIAKEGDIVDIGECVEYTGDNSYAVDSYTAELMDKQLVCYKSYKVTGVMNYCGLGVMHYIFENDIFLYPCESFTRMTYRKYIKEKYKLR